MAEQKNLAISLDQAPGQPPTFPTNLGVPDQPKANLAVNSRPEVPRKRVWLLAVLALLLFGSGVTAAALKFDQLQRSRTGNSYGSPTGYNTVTVPLSEFSQNSDQLLLNKVTELTITGQLNVNGSLRLVPTAAPTTPLAGQIYYDQATNTFRYYDGSGFVTMLNSQDGAQLNSQISQALGIANAALASKNGSSAGLPGGSSGQLLVVSSAGTPSFVTSSGDASISSSGVITIADGTVTNAKLANNSITISTSGGLTGGSSVALGSSLSLGLDSSVCTTANNCPVASGSSNYIQNGLSVQNSANFNIDGTGQAGNLIATVSLQSPSLDTSSATTLAIGNNNASLVTLGHYGSTTQVNGNLVVQFGSSIGSIDASVANGDVRIGTNATNFNTGQVVIGRYEVPTTVQGTITVVGTSYLSNLAFTGTNATLFTTPLNSDIKTRIDIPLYDPGNYGQIIALGLPFGASSTARVISIFDNRDVGDNQPPLAVFSPNEANLAGLSWDGYNNMAYIKTAGGDNAGVGIKTNGTVVATFTSTGEALNGNLLLSGHIASSGNSPTIAAGVAACTAPTVSVNGTDIAGTVTVTTGTGCAAAGPLATISFSSTFGAAPRVSLTARSAASATLLPYNGSVSTGSFTIDAANTPANSTTYTYNYLVVQ